MRAPVAVNSNLAELQEVQKRFVELQAEEGKTVETIRNSFKKAAVVFIDMVGSAQFKMDHRDDPETWIRRVYLFCEIVTQYIEALGGRVVKYIGDEVMAVFDGDACVNEASSLVARIKEIEEKLKVVVGVETRIKIALDQGDVCFLEFPGHEEIDPQGTAVDRCARIGKYTKEGVVLASFEFVKECPSTFNWLEVGQVELKGIGITNVYQMGEKTVDLSPVREIREDELRRMKEHMAEMEQASQQFMLENKQLCEMNEGLQEQIRKLGEEPEDKYTVAYEEEELDAWEAIEEDLKELRKIIDESPASSREYARFLFLDCQGLSDSYNKYEGRQFDESIEAKLVTVDGDGNFSLNHGHRRNQKALEIMGRLEDKLSHYEEPEDDLYSYSLEDPDFWHKNIGYFVR